MSESKLVKLAKKWNDTPTAYNRVQFLEEFNTMSEDDQHKAVQKGSELSKILIGWCSATRIELQDHL